MKIRHLKRASIARTLKRIAHEPVRRALMERGRRAGYFALTSLDRRLEKRRFRKVAEFFGGAQWGRMRPVPADKPLVFNSIRIGLPA